MASWMVHLRVADKLLDRLEGIFPTEFVVGNIAPDSGVPNEDWSVFTPSSELSHFKNPSIDGWKNVCIDKFIDEYFTKEQRQNYNKQQYSFFLGYYTHLLTDIEWVSQILRPSEKRFADLLVEQGKVDFVWTLKQDWYDLDFLYLKKHPGFRAFHIYENAVGFRNTFMDIFSEDAFENRRQYITGFYRAGRDNLEREYPYLTEAQAEKFVEQTVEKIATMLIKYAK